MSDPAVQDHLQAVHGVLLCAHEYCGVNQTGFPPTGRNRVLSLHAPGTPVARVPSLCNRLLSLHAPGTPVARITLNPPVPVLSPLLPQWSL
jgi:hypothetical protein